MQTSAFAAFLLLLLCMILEMHALFCRGRLLAPFQGRVKHFSTATVCIAGQSMYLMQHQ